MLEGYLEVNSYEMDDIFGNMNKTNAEIDTSNGEAKEDFISFKQSGVFGKGIKSINDQMDTITNSMTVMSGAIQKGTQAIFETEFRLLQEARDLEIPTGFETSDLSSNSASANISMNKNDGISVNSGSSDTSVKDNLDESKITSEEALYDMTGNNTEEQQLDENEITDNRVKIKDMANEGEAQIEELDDDYKHTDNINLFSMDDSTTEIPSLDGE